MCRGGVTGQGKFPKKNVIFWALLWTKSQEKLSTDKSVQLALFVFLTSWCDSQEMETAAYFLNWAIWLPYPWNANSAQCKVMILGRSWPLQPLRKCLLTSSCLSTHRCACACAIGTQPQNILSGWFGEEEVFWRVHRAEKPRQRIQRVLGKTCTDVPCL